MTVRVRRKEGKTIIETDTPEGYVRHGLIHDDRSLLGAMSAFGIEEVEGNDLYELRRDFDKKFKEKYGETYFLPE